MKSNRARPPAVFILVFFAVSIAPVSLWGQRDLSREILVYFKAGVDRQAPCWPVGPDFQPGCTCTVEHARVTGIPSCTALPGIIT